MKSRTFYYEAAHAEDVEELVAIRIVAMQENLWVVRFWAEWERLVYVGHQDIPGAAHILIIVRRAFAESKNRCI